MPTRPLALDPELNSRIATALARTLSPFRESPGRLWVVDVRDQRLVFVENGAVTGEWPVSTAANGIGGVSGSFRTPPGWHRVHRRIGAGVPAGTVFVSREPTGERWQGETRDDELILTRILTLEGLEDGVNRGPGATRSSVTSTCTARTTSARWESRRPMGACVFRTTDVIEVFDRAREGDPLVVIVRPKPERCRIRDPALRFHYAGVGGSGMSALAQFQAMLGGVVSGSDRGFDRGERARVARAAGAPGHRRDAAGRERRRAATARRSWPARRWRSRCRTSPRRARLALPLVHRSEMLAHWVKAFRSLAIAGTSGKSTVVAMTFEILRGAARDPSVITGGELVTLQDEGLWGNAWAGGSDLLVVEADESDGSLVRYSPAVGVVLNLTRDHRPESEVAGMFATLRERTREAFVCGEAASLGGLREGARVFGFGENAHVRATDVHLGPHESRFRVDGVEFALPVPGKHNVDNALAAIAACGVVGVPTAAMAAPLSAFRGVARRFQSLGSAGGIEVVDDFAHNPPRWPPRSPPPACAPGACFAVYQPHGYGPTRFLREDFVETFAAELRLDDRRGCSRCSTREARRCATSRRRTWRTTSWSAARPWSSPRRASGSWNASRAWPGRATSCW